MTRKPIGLVVPIQIETPEEKEFFSAMEQSSVRKEAILNAYKEAAECDEFMFGDYDFCNEWLGVNE